MFGLVYRRKHVVHILVQVTIYRMLLTGRDGHLDLSRPVCWPTCTDTPVYRCQLCANIMIRSKEL